MSKAAFDMDRAVSDLMAMLHADYHYKAVYAAFGGCWRTRQIMREAESRGLLGIAEQPNGWWDLDLEPESTGRAG